MDAVELTEGPSSARRRLSVVLPADDIAVRFAKTTKPPTTKGDDDPRVSIVGRRASAFTRAFALASTSESFREEDVRPTLINAMLFLDDPNPDIYKIRRVMSERLLDIPRFRSVFRQDEDGAVHWDPIPRANVDMDHHVRVVDGGGEFDHEEIEDLLNKAFLDSPWQSANEPLWRMTLVTNLKGDGGGGGRRSLLFCSIDHAIGDGVAMLAVMLSLLDDPDDGSEKKKSLQRRRKDGPSLRWSHRVVCFVGGIYEGLVQPLAPKTDPYSSLKIPAEKLNEPCPGKTFLRTNALDLNEVKALKDKVPGGATVNDLVLAVVTMGIRKFYERSGDPILEGLREGKASIRAEFPVNMRAQSSGETAVTNLGNELAMASFVFPMGYTSPLDALWRCKSRADELKASPGFLIKKAITDLLVGAVPDKVLASQINEASNKPTCMISNVMGPQEKASLGGYVLNDLDFTVTFPGPLYIGILSYDNKLQISIIMDRRTEADCSLLKECFEAAYDELKCAITTAAEEGEQGLGMPDMTPLSARFLEVAAFALPAVLLAVWMKS